MSELIGKGAEADLFLENNVVRKLRIPKTYRIKEIDDDLRKRRTRSESKILQKVGDLGPGFIDSNNIDELRMNFLNGPLLKHVLNDKVFLAKDIGLVIGKIHDLDIVHGDLTTSNMIFSNNAVKLIDFGLSFISDKVEDKAVDLHLFKEAVESKHFAKEQDIWNKFIEGYNPENKDLVLNRLSIVEARGRNKQKY